MLDDESDDDGYASGSAGTRAFPFSFEYPMDSVEDSIGCVDNYVGRVCGIDYGVFGQIGIESIGDVFTLVVIVPIGVESKGGRLIEIFWRPRS